MTCLDLSEEDQLQQCGKLSNLFSIHLRTTAETPDFFDTHTIYRGYPPATG